MLSHMTPNHDAHSEIDLEHPESITKHEKNIGALNRIDHIMMHTLAGKFQLPTPKKSQPSSELIPCGLCCTSTPWQQRRNVCLLEQNVNVSVGAECIAKPSVLAKVT